MTSRTLSLVCLTLTVVPVAHSQYPVPPSPSSPTAPTAPQAPMDRRRTDSRVIIRGGGDDHNMGILPPGTWWKNPNTVTLLGLTADQQKRMDDIFRQSRIQLIDVKASLEKEQLNLEPVLNTSPLDSGKALAEISKIADLRADLEKANAKMLLGLRSVLTADQWTKLQADRHGRHDGPMSPIEYFKGGPRGSSESVGPLALLDPDGLSDLQIRLTDRLADLQMNLAPLNVHIPEIHIPDIHIPKVEIPAITIPEIYIPRIDMPPAE